MQEVTFAKQYDHPLPGHRTAHYLAGKTYTVSNEVALAAAKAGKLEEKRNARSNPRGAPRNAVRTEGGGSTDDAGTSG